MSLQSRYRWYLTSFAVNKLSQGAQTDSVLPRLPKDSLFRRLLPVVLFIEVAVCTASYLEGKTSHSAEPSCLDARLVVGSRKNRCSKEAPSVTNDCESQRESRILDSVCQFYVVLCRLLTILLENSQYETKFPES